MLYIYGTVFNNKDTVKESIESLSRINVEKRFLITDNYSTDGTYEVLQELKNKYNITLKQVKCSRGKGRELAMELGYHISNNDDLFMYFDLDSVYTPLFIKYIEDKIKTLKRNEVFLNMLCYKDANFKILWKDLNNGEDWERIAHFIHEGFIYSNVKSKYYELSSNYIGKQREKRYARGIGYYKRMFKNQIDLFHAWNISNFKNLKSYMKYSEAKKWHIFILLPILIYSLTGQFYKYSEEINILYAKSKMILD